MMNNINREIYNVQNPAIGTTIIWRFICGYYSRENKGVPFPLVFLVLPIIFREDLCDIIYATQKKKGLAKLSEKLFEKKKNDDLYTINNTALDLRMLSLESINMGVMSRLFTVDYETAHILPLVETEKKNVHNSVKKLLNASEKLGFWCAGLSLIEICNLLKVRF